MIAITLEMRQDFAAEIQRLNDELQEIARGVPHEVLDEIGGFHALQLEQVFASEGGKTKGGHWRELSERYRVRKERLRPGRKILRWDGPLEDAFRFLSNEHHVLKIEGGLLKSGADHFLGPIHHEGFTGTVTVPGYSRNDAQADRGSVEVRGYAYRQDLPARPIIDPTPKQVEQLKAKQALAYIELLAQRVGGPIGARLARVALKLKQPDAKIA